MERKSLGIRIPADLHDRLRLVAFALRVPLNAVIAEAIERSVASHEQTGVPDDLPPAVRTGPSPDSSSEGAARG